MQRDSRRRLTTGAARLGWLLLLGAAPGLLFASEPQGAIPPGRDFGAGLSLEQPTDLAEIVADPERYQGRPVLVRGRISDVCQRKGCWTVLSQGESHLRVRFQDYAFFLPTDSSGKQAWVEGLVHVETLSEKQARHYASESREVDAAAIEGPQREVGLTASGLRLID